MLRLRRVHARGGKDHRVVAARQQVLAHNLADVLEHVVLHVVAGDVVEHLQVGVLDVRRDHLDVDVGQRGRGVHHPGEDRLGDGDDRLGLGNKVPRVVAPRRPVEKGRLRVPAVDGGHADQRGARCNATCLISWVSLSVSTCVATMIPLSSAPAIPACTDWSGCDRTCGSLRLAT